MELHDKLEQLSIISAELRGLSHFIEFGIDMMKIEYGNYERNITDKVLIEAIKETCSDRCKELESKAEGLMGQSL